ncbi:D-mannonate oxidoreductase [Psychromonas marina]|uniref:D-mannonate oxidoreductase n=1 Tax=Psychromonas marina TaxID=88364 RepID=A0ABQ6DZA8_9GAMM|nr:fructuronate reductase [Psychromonas marina]GLS90487.1 D-mannonate oxidoreductase [Psychromonas marina]
MSIASTPLTASVTPSQVDQKKLKSRIVHIGFGAFHRAHQALYTHDVLEKTAGDWGICVISLFSGHELIKKLRAQQHRYLVAEKGAHKTIVKEIASVNESLHPMLDGKQAVIEKMAEQQVEIVSMTITEKGYCIDHTTGKLDENNPLIQNDIATPSEPKSAIGYIVEALRLRRERGLQAFTVMSCDNVQENGHNAQIAVLGLARLQDNELAQWIESHTTFPSTMVDRIVPAVTPETLTEITAMTGVDDPCAVACEPFRQWIIEDNFVQGRPDWNIAGAEFVQNVVPFEEMKLRMLNGSHSFLAYLGYLGGYQHISDTMANPCYQQATLDLMLKVQAVSLNMPVGTDLAGYAELLIKRFSNPSLKHQTWQIAMDGSQKIPQRFVGSLLFHLQHESDYKWLAMGIAGWMHYVGGVDEQGKIIDVRDPLAQTFIDINDSHYNHPQRVKALLGIDSIFDKALLANDEFVETVTTAYQLIATHGAKQAVTSLSSL